ERNWSGRLIGPHTEDAPPGTTGGRGNAEPTTENQDAKLQPEKHGSAPTSSTPKPASSCTLDVFTVAKNYYVRRKKRRFIPATQAFAESGQEA
ncbi:unnamed protein product, partial [Amoebophrya sp. A120]